MADNGGQNRVVVTGMGAVTPQGGTLEEYWEGVRNGRVAIHEVQHLPMEGFRTSIGGEVQDDTLRLAGNTLLWQHAGVLVRLEAQISRTAAVRIAQTMR